MVGYRTDLKSRFIKYENSWYSTRYSMRYPTLQRGSVVSVRSNRPTLNGGVPDFLGNRYFTRYPTLQRGSVICYSVPSSLSAGFPRSLSYLRARS